MVQAMKVNGVSDAGGHVAFFSVVFVAASSETV